MAIRQPGKRNRTMKALLAFLLLSAPVILRAQHITYSNPEQEDSRRTNFEIIGRINGNVLIFKNNHLDNVICAYDNNMKLLGRQTLSFLPEKYLNVDFVQYPDFYYMIYEYQQKNTVHCSAVKMDGMAKIIEGPVDLDTTQVNSTITSKIYTTIYSENKRRIMVFKINSKNVRNFVITSYLYNDTLDLLDRHRIGLAMDEKGDMFSNFHLDNQGEFVFAKFHKSSNGDYISRVSLISKGPVSDSFNIRDLGTTDRILDDIKIKIDNVNQRYILTGFYYKQKKGNIEGLYTAIWDKASDTKLKETLTVFNDDLRTLAKSSEANLKMAFNDFFIKNIIVEKTGGYLVISESEYTTSRGSTFNRWDYMYGYSPFVTPLDYYSSYYSPYSPYNRYGYGTSTRYNSENILILCFDKNSNLEWSNVIPKTQFDDDSENLISHHIVNTGGELHFLYNQYERRTQLLSDQGITSDGKLTRYPTLRNLDKGYEFMPRYGKQISSKQIVMPCLYRNYLCFAKVEF
jgi:hypothetical protein